MSDEQAQPHMAAEDVFNLSDDDMMKMLEPEEAPAEEAPKAKKEAVAEEEEMVEVPLDEAEETAEEEAPEEEESEDAEDEEGEEEESEEETPPSNKPPLTKFKVFDKDGDELEIPAEIKFSYKANGREYEDVPLEKVVQLAQMGHYNHEREQDLKQRETKAEQASQRAQQLETALSEVNELVTRIFEDVEAYDKAREAYLAENTPEARARRSEQELTELKRQQREQSEGQYIAQFVQNDLAPSLESLHKGHPNVNEYEVQGKFTELIAPLLVRGRLPVDRIPYVKALVERDLTAWVKATHLDRDDRKTVDKKKLSVDTEKKALAKRAVARKVKTGGKSAGTREAPKKIETADDFLSSVLGPE